MRRVTSRVAFGEPIADQGVVQEWIAESRIRIEQARLLVLKTAWLMDTVGNKGARVEVSAIKAAVPRWRTGSSTGRSRRTAARASRRTSRSRAVGRMRTLHLADGPDEVHNRSIARRELAPYRNR